GPGGACNAVVTAARATCTSIADTNAEYPGCVSSCNASCNSFCGDTCQAACPDRCAAVFDEQDVPAFCKRACKSSDYLEQIADACEDQCKRTCGALCNYSGCNSCIQ